MVQFRHFPIQCFIILRNARFPVNIFLFQIHARRSGIQRLDDGLFCLLIVHLRALCFRHNDVRGSVIRQISIRRRFLLFFLKPFHRLQFFLHHFFVIDRVRRHLVFLVFPVKRRPGKGILGLQQFFHRVVVHIREADLRAA